MAKKNFISGFYPEFHVEKLVGNDDYRPMMNYVYFKNGYVYATDCHALVKMKLTDISTFSEEEVKMLEGKFLTKKSYERLRNSNYVTVSDKGFIVHDENNPGMIMFSEVEGNYPNVDAVISQNVNIPNKQPASMLKIKANYIDRICKAFGSDILLFEMNGENNAIIVKSANVEHSNFIGIIMPMLLD